MHYLLCNSINTKDLYICAEPEYVASKVLPLLGTSALVLGRKQRGVETDPPKRGGALATC